MNIALSRLRRALLPAVLGVGCTLLAGCARTPPAQYYLLSSPAGVAAQAPAPARRIGLGPVRLPEYLDRPQIVSWASPTRLHLSNSHRWAEPLGKSFARTLLANLGHALPDAQFLAWPWRATQQPALQVTVDVQRFERAADGTLVLDARWAVQRGPADGAPVLRRTSLSLPVAGAADDYDALVTAASAAVAGLARDIAARLPPESAAGAVTTPLPTTTEEVP
jgi:hypothetical protein